jgi:glycosyltransferase involved in cell wall biosynthesis
VGTSTFLQRPVDPHADRTPTVSIVTVVFNGARHIGRTLESVLAQRYPRIEVVVIDGGSSDGTVDVVRRYADRIHVFVSEPDRGIYDAMNKAIRRASGEYLVFMNCGDTFVGSDAVSHAMGAASLGRETVVFGCWVRSDRHEKRLCAPSLEAGLFNHQAIVYSRAIHRWHGDYVAVRGLTTADYLFFATLIASPGVDLKTIDVPIAEIDITGISAGLQTFSQKHAVDYLCGRTSRWKLVMVLVLHPLYFGVKRLWRSLR